MAHYEYKVIPAPARAEKAKGVKTPEGRFARTIESELNRMGEAGWEYLRAELLPSEERSGLKAAQTKWRTVLIFRRLQGDAADQMQARVLNTPPMPPDPVPVMSPALAAAPLADSDPSVPPLNPVLPSEAEITDPPLTAEPNVVPLPQRDEAGEEDTPPR